MGDSIEVELTQNGCTVFRCVQCSARFANMRSLSFHMRVHTLTFNSDSASEAGSDSQPLLHAADKLGSVFGKNGLCAFRHDAADSGCDSKGSSVSGHSFSSVSEFDSSKLQADVVSSDGTMSHDPLSLISCSTQSGGGQYGAKGVRCKSLSAADTVAEPVSRMRERSYKCSQCNCTFTHSADLMAHVCAHTGRLNGERVKTVDTNISEGNVEMTEFSCPECGDTFSRSCHLSRHLNRSHPSDEKTFCLSCRAVFCHPYVLQLHKCAKSTDSESLPEVKNGTLKSAALPVKTEANSALETGRAGSNLRSINQAKTGSTQRFVTNLRRRAALLQQQQGRQRNPLLTKCRVCNVLFRSHWLPAHMRAHEEPAPYKCQVCAAPFNNLVSFTWHIKKVHGDSFTRHTRKVHGDFRSSTSNDSALPNTDSSELQSENSSVQTRRRGRKPKCLQSGVTSEVDTSQSQTDMGDGGLTTSSEDLPHFQNNAVDSGIKTEPGEFRELGTGATTAASEPSSLNPQSSTGSESSINCPEGSAGSEKMNADSLNGSTESPRKRGRPAKTDIVPAEFKLYKCQHCSEGFSRTSLLEKHVKTHQETAKPLPFFCQFCSAKFQDVRSLSLHIRNHSEGRVHVCHYCGQSFTRRFNMQTHINSTHKGLHASSFGMQNDRISNPSIFKKDLDSNGTTSYICKVCLTEFTTPSSLGKHMSKHRAGPKPFACQYCSMTFGNPWNLRLHQAKHVRQQAKFGFVTQIRTGAKHRPMIPRKQVKQEPPAEEENGAAFTMRKSLMILNSMKRAPLELKSYYCQQCRETFPNHTSLKTHNLKVHGSASGNGTPQTGHSKNIKKPEAPSDVNVETSPAKETVRNPFSPKAPSARMSGGRFGAKGVKSQLTGKHRAVTGEKKFPCQHCTSAFTRRENLRAHMRTKHEDLLEQNSSRVESFEVSAGSVSKQTTEPLSSTDEKYELADVKPKVVEPGTGDSESEIVRYLKSPAKSGDLSFKKPKDASGVTDSSKRNDDSTSLPNLDLTSSANAKTEVLLKSESTSIEVGSPEKKADSESESSPPKPFPCQLCSSSFTRNSNLKLHLQSKHAGHKDLKALMSRKPAKLPDQPVVRPFSCKYCSASFTRKFNMKLHVEKHERKQARSGNQRSDQISDLNVSVSEGEAKAAEKNDSASDSEAVKTANAAKAALAVFTASPLEQVASANAPPPIPPSSSSDGTVGNKAESASVNPSSEPTDSKPRDPKPVDADEANPPDPKHTGSECPAPSPFDSKPSESVPCEHESTAVATPVPNHLPEVTNSDGDSKASDITRSANIPAKAKTDNNVDIPKSVNKFIKTKAEKVVDIIKPDRNVDTSKPVKKKTGRSRVFCQNCSASFTRQFSLKRHLKKCLGQAVCEQNGVTTAGSGHSEEESVDNAEETNQGNINSKSDVEFGLSGCQENGLPVENSSEESDPKPHFANSVGQVSVLTQESNNCSSQGNGVMSESENGAEKSDEDKSDACFGNSETTDFTSGDEQADGHSQRVKRVNRRQFICKICNASFIREYTLKIHMKKHEKQSPSSCQQNGISNEESDNISGQAVSAREKRGLHLKKWTPASESRPLTLANGKDVLLNAEKAKSHCLKLDGISVFKETPEGSKLLSNPVRESDSGSSWIVESCDSD